MAKMILNRYFSRQIWSSFIGFGLVLGGLAWMVQILLLMKLIIKYGIDVGGFVGMSLYTFPMLIGIITPFVIFIAVMFVYNKMIENNEITVCMASGRSPFGIAKPAIAAGLIVMAAHFALNVAFAPKSQDLFYRTQWNLRYGLGHLKLKESTFNRMTDNVVIYVEEINHKDMLGLTMRDGRNGDEKIITAGKGKLINTPSGITIAMGTGGFQMAAMDSVAIGTFDSAQMDLDMGESEGGGSSNARRASTPELVGMIKNLENYPERQKTKIMAEAATRFLSPLTDLLFILIAMAFLLKTNVLRRRSSLSAAYASFAMIAAETAFMSVSASASSVSTLVYLGSGLVLAIVFLLWLLRK